MIKLCIIIHSQDLSLYRYSFLAFSYDEEVKPNRDTCRLLLLRLKMDGWALGKSKVFLKYYHVEVLSRIYEEQVRTPRILSLGISSHICSSIQLEVPSSNRMQKKKL